MLLLACLLAAAAAAPAPATYDQRQDGEYNVRADVQNIMFIVAVPEKLAIPMLGVFERAKNNHESKMQERADVRVMEAFVEPNEPYHVEIGESSRTADGGGRAVEVVIAGRRRLDADEPQAEAEPARDEYQLLGATEQCGPDHERDPDTLACRARAASPASPAAPAPSPPASPASPAAPAPAPPASPASPVAPAPAPSADDRPRQPAAAPDQPSPEVVPSSS